MARGLILLDRDGVLNRLVVDPEHGTIDSPLHPSQVVICEGVAEAALRLNEAGFGLAIVTNQPAAAKGKTTRANLEAVHLVVVHAVESKGARIASSQICYHKSEDGCACRKPKTAMLEEAFGRDAGFVKDLSWMVGDGVTDIQAGRAFGVKTAFLGPRKPEYLKIFDEYGVQPDIWCQDLLEFERILRSRR